MSNTLYFVFGRTPVTDRSLDVGRTRAVSKLSEKERAESVEGFQHVTLEDMAKHGGLRFKLSKGRVTNAERLLQNMFEGELGDHDLEMNLVEIEAMEPAAPDPKKITFETVG